MPWSSPFFHMRRPRPRGVWDLGHGQGAPSMVRAPSQPRPPHLSPAFPSPLLPRASVWLLLHVPFIPPHSSCFPLTLLLPPATPRGRLQSSSQWHLYDL